MKVTWRLTGEQYHSLKPKFKSTRESFGFKYTSKWNSPTSIWSHSSGTKIEGVYVRMEVDGKDKTVSAIISVSGDDFDFIQKLRHSLDEVFPVKGEEPKIRPPKEAPIDFKLALHCFNAVAHLSLNDWAKPNEVGYMMTDLTIIRFQNIERKRIIQKFYTFLIDLKERFPNVDLTKLDEPPYLQEADKVAVWGADGEIPWNREDWAW